MIFHPENRMKDRAQNSIGEPLSLSLVIPLFNERENIRKVVIPIIRTLEPFVDSYELILVDNGSRDGTRREIEGPSARNFRKSSWSPSARTKAMEEESSAGSMWPGGNFWAISPETDRSPP